MSMLPPLSSQSLTRERLAELLAAQEVPDSYLPLLRWLIWFPLLSTEELTRLEQARLARRAQMRSPQRVAAILQKLEEFQLLAHLVVNEPGWPPHQHRYFLTDAGLYVFAARSQPPLSVPRLAQCYAVEREDLIARLARIDIHLALAEFSTRLVAEGSERGYPLTSFQQPWKQRGSIFGRWRTFRCDAAFLLTDPQGAEYAFYVRVDTDERRPFERKQERLLLLRLLNLRDGLHLQREAVPRLLILAGTSRFLEWGMLLEQICEQRGTALLDGAITTLDHLRHFGVHGPIWWTFPELVRGVDNGFFLDLAAPRIALSLLLGEPTSALLAERFSQRRTFAHLVVERGRRPLRKTSRPLPSYVGKPLTNEIATLDGTALSDALRGTKTEQREAIALLNLALSATQKELIFWLTHHQLLTVHHLAALHYPGGKDIRGVQRQMAGLASLNLLVPFAWYRARDWRERERYVLAEAALRYSALREGRPATYYLLSEEKKKRYKEAAFTIQPGTAGLSFQMEHTHGLYGCIICLLEQAHRENIRMITWKNAREAIRSYPDPFTKVTMQIRPDAEVTYQIEGQTFPRTILLEYDRATTTEQNSLAKYQTYADYLEYTRLGLPPILIITQHQQAATLIRTCIDRIVPHLSVSILLEERIQHQGLLTILMLDNNSG